MESTNKSTLLDSSNTINNKVSSIVEKLDEQANIAVQEDANVVVESPIKKQIKNNDNNNDDVIPEVGSDNYRLLSNNSWCNWTIILLTITIIPYAAYVYRSNVVRSIIFSASKTTTMNAMDYTKRRLTVASWNIAAINNNPFEYWITYEENPDYEKLMIKVEEFIENPGSLDVPVSQVFTETMFEKLDTKLTSVGWKSVKEYWDTDFKNRKIVESFLKDELLGRKRLMSMPDRVTNTINTVDNDEPIVFRPTIINMYDDDLSSLDKWYTEWETFMFDTPLKVVKSSTSSSSDAILKKMKTPCNNDDVVCINNNTGQRKVYEMLKRIIKVKYPDITEQEEKDSLPLQTLCMAIFDAILVHMMNTISSPEIWQPIKRQIVDSLNKKKIPNTINILERQYLDSDVITLQEVSSAFIDHARASNTLSRKFHIIKPKQMDYVRDQNSIILLSRETFPSGSTGEITDEVKKSMPEGGYWLPIADGDILAITTTTKKESSTHNDNDDTQSFVIASFHGDTNGRATIPVVDAIVSAMKSDTNSKFSNHHLIFGLDANTYEKQSSRTQNVIEFGKKYNDLGLTSCWGDTVQPNNYTTYNARTYLQPQLNKACRQNEKRTKGDVNPKDFILFYKSDYHVIQTWKDNTGQKKYIENMSFPTIHFPSDHGIIATIIEPKQ